MTAGIAPRLLVSVRDVAEARLAAELGAELIDLKEPAQGALGAVAAADQRRIVAALGTNRPPLSATVGDLPFEPIVLAEAIRRTGASGVEFVKFGVYASGNSAAPGFAALDRLLRAAPRSARLVALLLADRLADIEEAIALARLARQVDGVAGVMLDTAAKATPLRSLPDIFAPAQLSRFVTAVQATGGFAGLAGSLRSRHVDALIGTGADILGFRGALCAGSRNDAIDRGCLVALRDQLFAARARRNAALCPA